MGTGEEKMKLFYSYSHKDEEYREKLENHLSTLKRDGYIEDWHDRKILAGQDYQKEIDKNLEEADIIALLISSDFLSSSSCQNEMRVALDLQKRKGATVIPIIVRSCDWKSSDIRSLQSLPKDGKPVSDWPDLDAAFMDIVYGIIAIAKQELEIHPDFKTKVSDVEFRSGNKEDIELQDIFIFPHLIRRTNDSEVLIRDFSDIWGSKKYHLLLGDDRSGKTTICRKMFLERIESNESTLLLLSDDEIRKYGHQETIQRKFKEEFKGNYDIWKKKSGKMIIIDDFHIESGGEFLDFAKSFFDYIFITISVDQYAAYYRNQSFLSDFHTLEIYPFKHAQQEELIRKWKGICRGGNNQEAITDSAVDRLENIINAIVSRIVPRFPFYILSILQTYETFMPNLEVTAYAHCYYVLIVAQLMQAGIAGTDLDSTMNFLSSFAFDLYQNHETSYGYWEFSNFLENYKREFVIKEDTMDRLISSHKPIIKIEGETYSFRYPFAYYYLLGRYLSMNMEKCKECIENLTKENYVRGNAYTLIFTIHHSHNISLIDNILRYTRDALNSTAVAKLDREETRGLEKDLRLIPEKVLTEEKPIKDARKEERDRRDRLHEYDTEQGNHRSTDKVELNEIANIELFDMYRALKNMEILGQILTNKYGSLPREKLKEIIIAVNDAGLRLVRFLTLPENLQKFENFIKEIKDIGVDPSNMDHGKLEKLQKNLRATILLLVYLFVRQTSRYIGGAELSKVVEEVTNEQNTTSYKLIGLFFSLNSAQKVEQDLVSRVVEFLRDCSKKQNEVVRRIISLEVQTYCNTHNVDFRARQRLFNELGLRYRPNPT